MLKEVVERVNEFSPEEEEESTEKHSREEDLLIAVIVLAVISFVLTAIVIYGYWKFVLRRKTEMEEGRRERSSNMREEVQETPEKVPVKMRKRSMTFTETDEECRKYREDLADSYSKAETEKERSRKKSVVTFADVEEANAECPQ